MFSPEFDDLSSDELV